MNNKRQTIWLVSMLGLMVVLSAYYLFTDDVSEMDVATEEDMQGTLIDAVEVEEHSDLPELDELVAAQDGSDGGDVQAEAPEEAAAEEAQDPLESEEAAEAEAARENDEILQKVQAGAKNGEEFIAALEMERTEQLTKETDELFEIALDPNKSPEEVAKAEERLRIIEETQAKVGSLEDELMQEYENVIITQEDGRFNVVVKADKLERSQVVTIIDMVMDELQIGANKVSVEYVM